MNESQKSYLAAAIDGEGHISIGRPKEKKTVNADWEYVCNIGISNTNKNYLNYIKNITNMGIIFNNSIATIKHKGRYEWKLQIKETVLFLTSILPYLIIKKEQALLMLKFRETYEIKYGRFDTIPQNISILRELIYEEIIEYNKCGPNNIYYNNNPMIKQKEYKQNKLLILSKEQKNYLGSIIDGEGSINITRPRNQSYNRDWPYTPYIGVGNTNIDLLNYLLQITNIGIIETNTKETLTKKKSWVWRIQMLEILSFIEIILPYFIIKKEQVK